MRRAGAGRLTAVPSSSTAVTAASTVLVIDASTSASSTRYRPWPRSRPRWGSGRRGLGDKADLQQSGLLRGRQDKGDALVARCLVGAQMHFGSGRLLPRGGESRAQLLIADRVGSRYTCPLASIESVMVAGTVSAGGAVSLGRSSRIA